MRISRSNYALRNHRLLTIGKPTQSWSYLTLTQQKLWAIIAVLVDFKLTEKAISDRYKGKNDRPVIRIQ
ncbi:hypothetical protein H1P_3040003 [Hyella patelloides LEGE 07179]|uniref:Uncharacterized protein n=1 Tax=Hyella patelloides LEGE 07179 TaxID=945734 RepID=A0A563VUJ9_9CYAN|nr:hypothetical protein [Hyella patelloides]VEP15064.1 hypothetical protein H1P_3040003 [Hyella patelloides LEGE 07179]